MGEMKKNKYFPALFLAVTFLFIVSIFSLEKNQTKQRPQQSPPNPEALNSPQSQTGLLPHPMDLSHLDEGPEMEVLAPPPPAWDWRDYNGVTPVKNQSSCAVCWAFASTAVLESYVLINSGVEYDFSEQNVKECNDYFRGCYAGSAFWAVSYFTRTGAVLETCDPYIPDPTGVCNSSCPKIVQVTGWRVMPNDIDTIKNAVYNHGPVNATMYSSFPGFSTYDGSYVLYYTGNESSDHSVVIVGWDDNMPHAGGSGAWICKNSSWGGEAWGDNGFFYIAYGSARIGGFPNYYDSYKEYDESEILYHYDEAGWRDSQGYPPSTTAWGLVKFTAERDESIHAVDLWVVARIFDYTIQIYDDFDGNDVSNLLHSQSGGMTNSAGYVSIPLSTSVEISQGDDFYVVVEYDTTYQYPVTTDSVDTYYPIEVGKCFMSPDGSAGSWMDIGVELDRDICIRARAISSTVTSPVLSVTPASLSFSAAVGGTQPPDQQCFITNTGSGTMNWTVSDNSSWASCTPGSGVNDGSFMVTVDPAGMTAGNYTATITVSSPDATNSPKYVQVSLTVYAASSMQLSLQTATGQPSPGSGGTTQPVPGLYSYASGSQVSIQAQPYSGYRFAFWGGDVDSSVRYSMAFAISMDANKSVAANFCTLCGDVNGDLSVTPGDAQRAFEIYLGRIANPTLCELENADVNCDGTQGAPTVTPGDAQSIFRRFLGVESLPTDCSSNARAEASASISTLRESNEKSRLILDAPRTVSEDEIEIPIIIDNPYVEAFGFDLIFPSENLEFVAIDETEFTEKLDIIDTNLVGEGILRVGGYSSVPIQSSTQVLIVLVFRVIKEVEEPVSVSIVNAVDDVASVEKRPFLRKREFIPLREKKAGAISDKTKAPGRM